VRLAEANNGRTITVAKGATITVVLVSTSWMFSSLPGSVLQQVGPVAYAPAPINACVPGQGCGTVTVTYNAVGAGSARVNASRSQCGEARACTGSEGTYFVQVVVAVG
jgi:hypothetical protein